LGGVQLQHPGGYSSRYCKLEEDGGGIRGFGGFVEIVRLPHGRGARRAALVGLTVPQVGCHAGRGNFNDVLTFG
jgi:hypothetical protein